MRGRTNGPHACACGPSGTRGSVAALVLEALVGPLDLGLGVDTADPVGALDGLAGLQVLVDLEEVLDLQAVELRDVVDVTQVLHTRVRRGHAQQLVVAARLVRHPEHADRTALDEAAREGRLVQDDQRVQRVAVLAEGVLDEAVVGRVGGRGEEPTVQADPTGLVVHLVLVPRTLRDLDRDVELHRWLLHDQHIVLVVKCPSRRCVIAKGAGGRARAEALAGRKTACDAGRGRRPTASGTGRRYRTPASRTSRERSATGPPT